jgi:hypothetical protein
MNIAALFTNPYVQRALFALGATLIAWGFSSWRYHVGYAAAERDREVADLVAYKNESERLSHLSDVLESRIAELRDVQPKIIERYHRVVVTSPLPADCLLDPERLQLITRAIEAANTGEPVKPLPQD